MQASRSQYASSSAGFIDPTGTATAASATAAGIQLHADNAKRSPAASLLPPARDFPQLMQNNPWPTQNTVDFSELLQTAPSPQPQVSHAPPVVRTPIAPTPAQSSNHALESTNKMTTTKTTNVVGSTSRREAAEKGKKELRRFDEEVSNRIKRSYDRVCPFG